MKTEYADGNLLQFRNTILHILLHDFLTLLIVKQVYLSITEKIYKISPWATFMCILENVVSNGHY